MAPNEKEVLAAIRKATHAIYAESADSLTVRSVRQRVTSDLDLDEDFFTSDEWKEKSKGYIRDYAVGLTLLSITSLCSSSSGRIILF